MILASMLIVMLNLLCANNLSTVENPTASLLNQGEVRIVQKIYKMNSMMLGAEVGLFDIFQFGMAYGAEEVVGDNDIKLHNIPAFKAKVRLLEETFVLPAIALGVDTQGHGSYYKKVTNEYDETISQNRFEVKSKGGYAVLSKNFIMWGLIGFDLGANYTFEGTKDDQKFAAFAGMYKTIGEKVTVLADFSAGFNDRDTEGPLAVRNRGFLNSALQFQATDQLAVKFMLHDMFRNRKETNGFDRSILIDYRWHF